MGYGTPTPSGEYSPRRAERYREPLKKHEPKYEPYDPRETKKQKIVRAFTGLNDPYKENNRPKDKSLREKFKDTREIYQEKADKRYEQKMQREEKKLAREEIRINREGQLAERKTFARMGREEIFAQKHYRYEAARERGGLAVSHLSRIAEAEMGSARQTSTKTQRGIQRIARRVRPQRTGIIQHREVMPGSLSLGQRTVYEASANYVPHLDRDYFGTGGEQRDLIGQGGRDMSNLINTVEQNLKKKEQRYY